MKKKCIVLGGYGGYGSLIARELSAFPELDVIAAGRNVGQLDAAEGIKAVSVDIQDRDALSRVLSGADLLINASGHYFGHDYDLPRLCAESGVNYIDLAEARDYVVGFARLADQAREKNVFLVSGCGCLPALSVALVDTVRAEFERIRSIRVLRSIGNRNPGTGAVLHRLLTEGERTVRVRRKGFWQEVRSWSEPRRVAFPAPVGTRLTYLADCADLDLLAERYAAETVIYRFGFELPMLNRGLAIVFMLRRRGSPWAARLERLLLKLARRKRQQGHDNDIVGVHIHGDQKGGEELVHGLYLISKEGAGVILPCAGAVALVHKWLKTGTLAAGAHMAYDLVDFTDLRDILQHHDVVLVRH